MCVHSRSCHLDTCNAPLNGQVVQRSNNDAAGVKASLGGSGHGQHGLHSLGRLSNQAAVLRVPTSQVLQGASRPRSTILIPLAAQHAHDVGNNVSCRFRLPPLAEEGGNVEQGPHSVHTSSIGERRVCTNDA